MFNIQVLSKYINNAINAIEIFSESRTFIDDLGVVQLVSPPSLIEAFKKIDMPSRNQLSLDFPIFDAIYYLLCRLARGQG